MYSGNSVSKLIPVHDIEGDTDSKFVKRHERMENFKEADCNFDYITPAFELYLI